MSAHDSAKRGSVRIRSDSVPSGRVASVLCKILLSGVAGRAAGCKNSRQTVQGFSGPGRLRGCGLPIIRVTKAQIEKANKAREAALLKDAEFRAYDERQQLRRQA